jgi:hypothetical protein
MLPRNLFKEFIVTIIYLFPVSPIRVWSVMHVGWQKGINYLIPHPIVFHLNLLSLSSLMYGDWHQLRWVSILIMSVLYMILANSPRFICCVINLKCFSVFVTSNPWWNESSILRSLLYNLIGGWVSIPSLLFLATWHYSPSFLPLCTSAKWICRTQASPYSRGWTISSCTCIHATKILGQSIFHVCVYY